MINVNIDGGDLCFVSMILAIPLIIVGVAFASALENCNGTGVELMSISNYLRTGEWFYATKKTL